MDKLTANELRIGNLLEYNGDIREVAVINLTEVGFKVPLTINAISIHRFAWDSVKPIPLTEEWLVRMGFLQSIGKYGNEFHILEKNGFTVMFTVEHWTNVDNESKYKNNWHVKNMLNGNKLKYVHQLQNLYWCLCGEELTIKSN